MKAAKNTPGVVKPSAAPIWVVLCLLVFELTLLACCGEGKLITARGWPALVCVSVVCFVLLLLGVLATVGLLLRSRPQFSLTLPLLVVLAVAIATAWLTADLRRAQQQRKNVAALIQQGGGVLYDYNFANGDEPQRYTGVRPGETVLHRWLGDDFFHEVVGVHARDDQQLAQLADLTAIRRLYLHDSQITNEGLLHIARLNRMEWLDLRDAPAVTGNGLAPLQGKTRMKGLLLTRTAVGDEGMVHVRSLVNLEVLDLGMTPVSNKGLQHLSPLTKLRQLTFWGNKIEDSGLMHLRGMTNLETLDLGGAPITSAGLANLDAFTQLRSLGLRGSQITDAGLSHLHKSADLRRLDLFNTRVTDASVDVLSRWKHLETLYIGETDITEQGVMALRSALPGCRIE